MINILRMQEILKGVPEEALIKEMQNPTGAAPLFLVASRLQEVKKLKEQYALEQQQADTTVAEDLVGAKPGSPVASPVGGARPPATMSPPPPGTPLPAGPSPVAGLPPPSLPSPPPVRMESGGRIGYEEGGDININEAQFEKFLKLVQAEARDPETQRAVASVILNRVTVGGGEFGDTLEEVMLKSGAFEPIGDIIKENKGKMDWDKLASPSPETRANITKWFNEGSKDSTDGALFFINKQLTDERETTHPIFENWDESMRLPDGTKRIGKMLFSNRFDVGDKIDRVKTARAAGEPTITVAGVDTAPITKPRDLIAERAAFTKAQPINIPRDAGAAVDEPQVTAQGHPITSWGEGIEMGFPGLGDYLARLTAASPTGEIDRVAEAQKYITGVTTGEPQFSAQGQLLSGWSGAKTGQDARTYTAPFTPAIAAYEPLPDDPGFNMINPRTKRQGLSPYNIAGMLKGAQDQVVREDRQVAQDALRLQNYANQAELLEQAELLGDENTPVAGDGTAVLPLAVTPPVSTDQFALEQRVAGPFSYMQNPPPFLINPVGSNNQFVLADNGGPDGDIPDINKGVGPDVVVPDYIRLNLPEIAKRPTWFIENGTEAEQAAAWEIINAQDTGTIPAWMSATADALKNTTVSRDARTHTERLADLHKRGLAQKQAALDDQADAQAGLGLALGHGDVGTHIAQSPTVGGGGLPSIEAIQAMDAGTADESLSGAPYFTRGQAGLPVYKAPVSQKGTPDARDGTRSDSDYLFDLEESLGDAKGLGILMAGLGIMGQASKPGATLGSSLPGAAAGVKTYMDSSKDIRKTALEREKMRRLANYQQQNLAAKPYQAMRANMIDAYSRHPQLSKQYGSIVAGKWQPNADFENLVIQKARTSSSADQLREELTYAKIRDFWGKGSSSPGKKWERARRKILERKGMEPDAIRAQIAREREGEFNKWLQGIREQRGIGVVPTAAGALSGDNRPSLSSPFFNKPR